MPSPVQMVTPLHSAAACGRFEVVKVLVAAKADVNVKDVRVPAGYFQRERSISSVKDPAVCLEC